MMMFDIDPGVRALLTFLALGAAGYLWVFITDLQFTRKYGPDPK